VRNGRSTPERAADQQAAAERGGERHSHDRQRAGADAQHRAEAETGAEQDDCELEQPARRERNARRRPGAGIHRHPDEHAEHDRDHGRPDDRHGAAEQGRGRREDDR